MDDNLYRLIYPDFVRTSELATGDEIASPIHVSVIDPASWKVMCDHAGSEEFLLDTLGIKYEVSEDEI